MIVLYVMPALWKYSVSIADRIGYRESEIIVSIIFMLVMNTVNSMLSLPFSIYSVFVIEEKHGFNKQVKTCSFLKILISWCGMVIVILIISLISDSWFLCQGYFKRLLSNAIFDRFADKSYYIHREGGWRIFFHLFVVICCILHPVLYDHLSRSDRTNF